MEPVLEQTTSAETNDYLTGMFGEGYDMEYDDSGQLQFVQQAEKTGTQTTELLEPVAPVKVAASESSSSGAEGQASEARFQKLESSLQQTSTMLQQLMQVISGQQQPQQQEVEEEDEETYVTPKAVRSMIEKTLRDALPKILQPLQSTAEKTELYMAYNQAATEYGADFIAKLPAIKTLMTGDAGIKDFSTAYKIAKSLESVLNPNATSSPNGTSQTPQKKPAQPLIDRAVRMQTLQGVNGNNVTKKPEKYGSIKAAADAAWSEHFGQ